MWTYFNNLDDLPTLDKLFRAALLLYDNYSTPRAGTIFKLGCKLDSPVVSVGEPWREEEDTELRPGSDEAESVDTEQEEGSGEEPGEQKASVEDEEFEGDYTLMRSAF